MDSDKAGQGQSNQGSRWKKWFCGHWEMLCDPLIKNINIFKSWRGYKYISLFLSFSLFKLISFYLALFVSCSRHLSLKHIFYILFPQLCGSVYLGTTSATLVCAIREGDCSACPSGSAQSWSGIFSTRWQPGFEFQTHRAEGKSQLLPVVL